MNAPAKQALADRSDRPDDLVAPGRQTEMIFRPGQKALSLRASKMWHLLVKQAGVDLAADKLHTMPVADLYDIGHLSQEERIDTLRELQTTLVEIRVPSPKVKGRMRIISGPLLSHVERDEDDRGDLVFEFSRTMRRVFADSPHWAVLSKRAVMAFESRYALRLFEIVSLRINLEHVTSERFSIEALRSRLGVTPGKFVRWPDLRRFVLEAAIAEVNQLAGFTVGYKPVKKGRAVAAVELSWERKPGHALAETKRELDSSKVGRKARREGTAETVVEPELVTDGREPATTFPVGSIRDTSWGRLALEHLPHPQRDIDIVARRFRQHSEEKGIPLSGATVKSRWVTWCKGEKPAN